MNDETRSMRESFFAEILMSLIISLSIQSCLMFIRGFNEYVTITFYPPLFGANMSNKVYLGITVFFFTVSSFSYRLTPRIVPSDVQVASIPACVFPITGIFYAMMGRPELLTDLVSNTILCAVLFLVMRQVAVFDTKYYHSIRSSSRPQEQLKKQNYRTAAALVGIFALSLVTNIILAGLKALLRWLIPLFLALLEFIGSLFKNIKGEEEAEEEMLEPEELLGDAPWVHVLSVIIAIIILIGFVLLLLNAIRIVIRNAPKYGKEKESENDGIVTDTIENIALQRIPLFWKRHDFGKGRERKIRKQFYDKTVRAMRKGLPVSDSSTPGEIEKVLTENGDTAFSQLRKDYENVRYGN